MPLFDYHCPGCGAALIDVLVKRQDDPIHCTTCGRPMKKLPSAPSPHFKGPGFYETDYKRSDRMD